jgi:hypothetical protein
VSGLGHIGDEVARELGRFGPAAGMGDIVAAWPEAVGPQIASNAWPARLARDGTLHVATSSSAWAFELTQLESQVRARLSEFTGDFTPTRLRFAVGTLPEPASPAVPSEKRTEPKVGPALRAEGERIAAPINDPELREAVAQAIAASLAAARARTDGRSV